MPLAAASEALVRHLRDRLGEAGASDVWDVEAVTMRQVREAKSGRGVALVL
jgi:hypothetical protein